MYSSPLLALALVLVTLAAPAQAITWHVPSECPTIQAGIDAASAGDTVLVETGDYYEHDIVMKSGLHLRSETGVANSAVIRPESQGRAIYCADADSTTRIIGFTFMQGSVAGRQDSLGGGMYCENSEVRIVNCEFHDNDAAVGGGLACGLSDVKIVNCDFRFNSANYGGGMTCGNCSPTLTDCLFTGNSAAESGIALFCWEASPTVMGCEFTLNEAGAALGGIKCSGPSDPVFDDCSFSQNVALFGGGMYCDSGAAVTITNSTFSDNDGGALSLDYASASLTDVTFLRNVASFSGGGIACIESDATLLRVDFLDNIAPEYGGGFYYEGIGSPSLTSCTFAGNTAETRGGGGGMYVRGGQPLLQSCTFFGNDGLPAGGVFCEFAAIVTLEKCIVASSTSGSAIVCESEATAVLSCSDVYGNAGGDWIGCLEGQDLLNDNLSTDPLFCDAPAGDLTIDANSPCCGENNPACGLVGAWGVGCDSPVTATSWGAIKGLFR